MKHCTKWVAIGLVISTALLLACATTPTQPKPSDVGSEATIQAPNLDEVHLAIDKQAFDEWIKACVAKDYIGMLELQASGRVFTVPNVTKVLVIDSSFASREVRILEGDAFGKAGWLPYEWLK